MNVAFRADGTEEKGLGHLMRCGAIAEQFLNENDQVCFYCSFGGSGIRWLKEKGFPVIELFPMDTLIEEADQFITLLKKHKVDILFLDSYWLSEQYIKKMQCSGAIVIAIDDNELYPYNCDILINCNLGAEEKKYKGCNIQKKLLGGEYNILRADFQKTPQAVFRDTVQNVLVTLGGSDANNYTPIVIEGIMNIPDINITVVYGPLMRNKQQIETIAGHCKGNVTICENPLSMAYLMSKSDLAISAGGGTVRELFSMGVVSLFILQAENQLPLADYLKKYNLPLCLGYYKDVPAQKIEKYVLDIMENTKKRKMIQTKIKDLLNKNGVLRIIQETRSCCIQRNIDV